MRPLTSFRWLAIARATCLFLASGAGGVAALGADLGDFKSAKREIQTKLRSREPADRVAALRELAEFKEVDAAKLVLATGFKNAAPEVRRAAFETLLAYKDEPKVADFLFTSFSKQKNGKGVNEVSFVLLATLLSSNLPEIDERLFEQLDAQSALPRRTGVAIVVALAEQLGTDASKLSFPPLAKLTRSGLFAREFGVRRTIVHALTQIQDPAAVDLLIGLLGSLQGEVQADIGQYLTELTDQRFDVDAKAWKDWWDKNRASFRFTSTVNAGTFRQRHVIQRTASYYGLPLYAQRLVFVMDVSGSMRGARLDAAKRELINAIKLLRETDYFSVLVFNSKVNAWQKQLVPASVDNKQAAAQFVLGQQTGPLTASYDALEASLTFDAEAVYFLSDGAPFGGKITRPVDIVVAITQLNQTRRMSLYTIGIGVGAEGNAFDEFLKTLAGKNLGAYRRVDE